MSAVLGSVDTNFLAWVACYATEGKPQGRDCNRTFGVKVVEGLIVPMAYTRCFQRIRNSRGITPARI
jgi:hypothetical protein